MIIENTPISMPEALEYSKGKGFDEEKAKGFIKKFTKLKSEEAKKIKEKLEQLDLMKMKQENIIKIIDLLPEDEPCLNKIFLGVNLDEDETKKILEIVKDFK